VNAVLRRAKSRHLGSFEADPADFSRDTPFLEIASRLDAGGVPLGFPPRVAPTMLPSAAPSSHGVFRCGAPGTVCPHWFGQFGVGAGSPTSSSATEQPASGEGEKVVLGGRASVHELPNMVTHREKLRAIHAADDITDNGCQYTCCC
jgi:hypothetical protein